MASPAPPEHYRFGPFELQPDNRRLLKDGATIPLRPRAFDCVDVMREIAGQRGASVAQIALAWLLHQPQVTSVIIGAKKAEQLADNIGATKVALGADELKRLDAESRLPPEYPGWMFTRQGEERRKQLAEAGRAPAA